MKNKRTHPDIRKYKAINKGEDFVFVDLNKAGEDFCQVKRKDVIGRAVTEVFPGVKPMGLFDCFKKCYETGESQYLPLTQYADDQLSLWAENHTFKLPSGNVVTLFDDRTLQHQLEDRLRQSEKMEAIGKLAGGIAHDFNNILAAVIGFSDMAKDELPQSHPVQNYIEMIIKASDRAKNLVKQILSFSRKSAERRVFLYLKPIINEVIQLLKATLPSSIQIQSRIENDTLPVLGDPVRVHEVIMNLSTNAADAMGEKGVLEINYSEETIEKNITGQLGLIHPGLYSVITIADNGCGMEPQVLSHIFEPFYTTKEVGRGTGMGLAVVFGIIQNHEGNIIVQSQKNVGTTFKVYFPKTEGELEEQSHDSNESARGNEKILFVDDEKILTTLADKMLKSLGYEVMTFNSSLKAFEQFKQNPSYFDLIITDQTMPGMTGLELSQEILVVNPDIPIILCTGFSSTVNEEQALASGISGYLLKPLKKKEIAIKIRELLD